MDYQLGSFEFRQLQPSDPRSGVVCNMLSLWIIPEVALPVTLKDWETKDLPFYQSGMEG